MNTDDSSIGNGYQIVDVYGSNGRIIETLRGNTALYDFQQKNGQYIDMSSKMIRAKSTVTLGTGIKYTGSAIGGASKALIVPSSGASAPGVILGNGLWGFGLGLETYGYFQLGNYNKMWTNILTGSAMKGAPKAYKTIQKKFK